MSGTGFAVSRREAVVTAAALYAIAVVIRIVAANRVPYPVPEDTAYYVDAAANLVHGRGFVVDAIWSYQTPPLVLPRPAFEVWLPLPSLLMAVPMALFGDGFRVAQAVSVVIGALIPVLAWRLGADVAAELRLPPGRARTLAVGSGLMASVLPAAVVYSTLPDSTAPFAVLALVSCLLMARLLRSDSVHPVAAIDRRLIGLGAILGLAALCRSEAIWLAAAWAPLAWFATAGTRAHRATLIAVPGAIAALVFLPWALRDWLVFGQLLPGQTLANALSVRPTDIYAYADPPTLERYLAEGPAALLQMRITGTLHNIVNVLVLPALPTGVVGVVGLPRAARLASLRPLLLFSLFGFLAASLVFPVATTWGTFLHESLAVDVLLVVATAIVLDALIAAVGRFRGWTRPVAWLGPAFGVAVAVPLLAVALGSLAGTSTDAANQDARLPATLAAAGITDRGIPIITDRPIWLARATGFPAIALPDEAPADVSRLAHDFGAEYVVILGPEGDGWPDVLEAGAGAECFARIPIASPAADTSGGVPGSVRPAQTSIAQVRVFRVVCR